LRPNLSVNSPWPSVPTNSPATVTLPIHETCAFMQFLGGAWPWPVGVLLTVALRDSIGWRGIWIIIGIGALVIFVLAPVAQRGALLAIGTAVSTSAGLLAPYVMGRVVETAATPLNGFNTGFMICGVAARRRAHVLGVERLTPAQKLSYGRRGKAGSRITTGFLRDGPHPRLF
jgi:hypothetical protein